MNIMRHTGLNADKWKVERKGYEVVPEIIDENMVKQINESLDDARANKGWTKSRDGKLIGRIPYDILYNYAWANGVPNHKHNDWYAEDGGKNYIRLLEEFPVFKVSNA